MATCYVSRRAGPEMETEPDPGRTEPAPAPHHAAVRETEMPDESGSIEQVKKAWEARLLAIPGVMGVGIGLTRDRKQKAIKVYLDRRSSSKRAQIPDEIEGHPVVIEVRGTFRPVT